MACDPVEIEKHGEGMAPYTIVFSNPSYKEASRET
jgi:hypothetical protein